MGDSVVIGLVVGVSVVAIGAVVLKKMMEDKPKPVTQVVSPTFPYYVPAGRPTYDPWVYAPSGRSFWGRGPVSPGPHHRHH